jgi:hypothetical protein
MAERESSENPFKIWLWGYRVQHFATHSCVVALIHRHLLTDLRHGAVPHHLTKYTPPGGLTVVVIVMITAQIH